MKPGLVLSLICPQILWTSPLCNINFPVNIHSQKHMSTQWFFLVWCSCLAAKNVVHETIWEAKNRYPRCQEQEHLTCSWAVKIPCHTLISIPPSKYCFIAWNVLSCLHHLQTQPSHNYLGVTYNQQLSSLCLLSRPVSPHRLPHQLIFLQ